MMRIHESDLRWMEGAARKEIDGCRRQAFDGTILFTPDGVGNYGALWTRDFAYMLPLFDLFDREEALAAIRYLIAGQRGDGVVPDRRQVDGVNVYEAGGRGHPVGLPPLDNSAFMVSLVYEYISRTKNFSLVDEFLLPLHWAMQAIPRGPHGLVWNHPQLPHSPYGFTDTIGKTGELLFCSLLDWNASRDMVALCRAIGNQHLLALYATRMKEMEEGIESLIDPSTGLFLAASEDCRQVDVWGNAFAAAIDFPIAADRFEQIVELFTDRYDDVIERGQVRHLVKGEYWERLLLPVKAGDYQNGGYWGTPAGWVMKTMASTHPKIAETMLRDLVEDYRNRGIHEWVNGERVRLPHYVASITNPTAAIRDLLSEKKAVLE